jgi:hypothetical protein
VSEHLPTFVDGWKGHSAFQEHLEILDRAVERYLAGDYVSCTGLLGGQGKPTNPKLSKRSVEGQPMIGPLMPARFLQYLETVYFKNYRPDDPGPKEVSRHSVGHGDAPAASFNKKSATIGLLVARQLSFTFRPMPWSGDQPMP